MIDRVKPASVVDRYVHSKMLEMQLKLKKKKISNDALPDVNEANCSEITFDDEVFKTESDSSPEAILQDYRDAVCFYVL